MKQGIALFGASKLGEYAYFHLKDYYKVEFFVDNDSKKWGNNLKGIAINSPEILLDNPNIDIIITSTYFLEISKQLLDMGIKKFQILFDLYDDLVFAHYNDYGLTIEGNIQKSFNENMTVIEKTQRVLEKYMSKQLHKKNGQRVFMISDYYYIPGIGGPVTVMHKLFKTNEKYKEIENFYMLCGNMTMEPYGNININKVVDCNQDPVMFEDYGFERTDKVFYKIIEFKKICKIIKKMHEEYNFAEDDIYIFHDENTLYAFSKMFPNYRKVVHVHHCQGSRFNEYKATNGIDSDEDMRHILNYIHSSVITKYNHFGFPSLGAYHELFKTEPDFEPLMKNKQVHVLYNGYDRKESLKPSEGVKLISNRILNATYKFISVATLNEAKGVERIPEVLKLLLRDEANFIWVIVGSGIKERELEENIKKYELQNRVLWIKDKISHDDILYLFNITDFYIMMHRNSIFDFATIEAMAHGNIPLLSNVGGNKEVITDENGIFIDEIADDFDFMSLSGKISQLSDKNKSLVANQFSELNFLKRYSEVVRIVDNYGA